jgi:uncharacterized protein (DUF1778 family)
MEGPRGGLNWLNKTATVERIRAIATAVVPLSHDGLDTLGKNGVRHLAYNGCMASKTERLSLRLTPGQDAVLRRAAEARGESANDFVLRHAVEAAEMELADRRAFVVDDAAWSRLQDLLSAPPALPESMVTLLSNPSVLERPA